MIPTIDPRDVERFRASIARLLGLQFDAGRRDLLAEVLRTRLTGARERPDVYLSRLETQATAGELRALGEALTVGETYFFRHAEQFLGFSECALPNRLAAAGRSGRPIQILSAGCGSGEEPYSVAIAVRTRGAGHAASILGVDINAGALERAARGRFSPWTLRDTPPDIRRRWFRPEGREFVLDETLRASVRF